VKRSICSICALVFVVVLTCSARADSTIRRRALLVGINDYSASRLSKAGSITTPDREWKNLKGTLNDVKAMREALVGLYEFDPRNIKTLTDQRATRPAILGALETIAAKSGKGDIVYFYYAGHGSRVRNTLSDEPDQFDESIVPADSRAGARDIRDKELRAIFHRILDRGARLTVILDSCYSGSAFRGDVMPRGIKPDRRDVADGTTLTARPEDRGAFIVAGAQDHELAFEVQDEYGQFRGAFSWAWLHAMRDAVEGEPGIDTFLRARARLSTRGRPQHPVLAADEGARQRPFLGLVRRDRREGRVVVSVRAVRRNGTVLIDGGWINGITVGTELRTIGGNTRIEVTALIGVSQCEGRARSLSPEPSALLEIVSWAAPPGEALRVHLPRIASSAAELTVLATAMALEASSRAIDWIEDPLARTPTHLLRWNGRLWEILGPDSAAKRTAVHAMAALAQVPDHAAVFVQWPLPESMAQRVPIGPGTPRTAVEPVAEALHADYVLVGRFSAQRIDYSWMRPFALAEHQPWSVMPLRTEWQSIDSRNTPYELTQAAMGLQRIHAWQLLASPPDTSYPYRLALRRTRDRELVNGTELPGGEQYGVVLRRDAMASASVMQRYVYVFVIDSFGRGTLLFPRNAAVENWFPIASDTNQAEVQAVAEITLGKPALFRPAAPFGVDTYLLLTTDEPLANPWILQWDGVRKRDAAPATPLEELLANVGSPERSVVSRGLPVNWSIQRVVFHSVAPAVGRSTP
jgi:hypothetical protein